MVDASLIEAIAKLGIDGILIYLLLREQAQKEKLLDQLVIQARQHAENLVQMACRGFVARVPDEKQ